MIRSEVRQRLDGSAFRVANVGSQRNIRRGTGKTLDWLEQFPGESWQERWWASGSEARPGRKWLDGPLQWRREIGELRTNDPADLMGGLNALICADVIRPSYPWLLSRTPRLLVERMSSQRDPRGFADLQAMIDAGTNGPIHEDGGRQALIRIALIMAAKGGQVRDITPGDCVELLDHKSFATGRRGEMRLLFYDLLLSLGHFPVDAPATIRAFRNGKGQLSVEELVDRYDIRNRPIRGLIIDYLKERAPAMDYGSIRALSAVLAGRFWADLETHHPGISSLNLDFEVAAAWKERLKTRIRRVRNEQGHVTDVQIPRGHFKQYMMVVRAFYLDIARWAVEDPSRWARWTAPCPIKDADTVLKKEVARHKAKMDHRTRQRLPVLPILVTTADDRRKAASARLRAAAASEPGEAFAVGGETLVRANSPYARSGKVWALEPDTDTRRNLTREENETFWAWACIEVLRATGVRIEELLELTHHSITEYRLPATGELVPLLQIAPSKTDVERLLLVSPELADVLSAIVCRIRTRSGAVPLVPSYDGVERVWHPPMPLLFQHRHAGENRALSANTVRRLLVQTLLATGLTDASNQPLLFTPHDFRRLFITDAILNGLPPHIAQVIAGHRDINTTMGYKAVYPQETIEAHRAFIGRRRAIRPSEEYRTPTDQEWDAFLAHFEKRKVSIGTCGRAFNSTCVHEHALLTELTPWLGQVGATAFGLGR